ncbi:hypothetical protein [Microvirga sp. 17 mud 1-3]|uniref:hypothetical protein n=1 Tax=Microvirga sp. 17 mud 1-3 TaxID=2082949 RepID=UPI000D6D96B8|nr:hypothetical protein [Microvirga sp. 17 mud 1-3]AWM87530.1 hypothetical protein C4E04_12835 [Microvirga sp. 17 mud 1-3]
MSSADLGRGTVRTYKFWIMIAAAAVIAFACLAAAGIFCFFALVWMSFIDFGPTNWLFQSWVGVVVLVVFLAWVFRTAFLGSYKLMVRYFW